MRIGLVLGAGGVVGGAYHAGALAALEHDLGWDPRDADVIVGTSAGSLAGALLRRDIPASDLAAWTVGAPLSPSGWPIADIEARPEFDPVTISMFMRLPRPPHPQAVWLALRNPRRFDPMRALMTHLADGNRSLVEHVDFLGDTWPERDLYLCAVRRRDGRRRVFGRTHIPNDGLRTAVAASCAVPGYFAPVFVDGEPYIDGGIRSASNADTLRLQRLDLVIALSPMSTVAKLPRYSLERVVRERTGRQIREELRMLERHGMQTMLLEPGEEVLEHVSTDFMSEENAQKIVAAAFMETGQQLRERERVEAADRIRGRRHAAA